MHSKSVDLIPKLVAHLFLSGDVCEQVRDGAFVWLGVNEFIKAMNGSKGKGEDIKYQPEREG